MTTRVRAAALAGVLAILATVLATAGLPAARADSTPTAVVVVGVPGLQWEDVTPSATPTLSRLAGSGSVGALSIRSADDITCPPDGWLTVGAGNRVRVGGGCASYPSVVAASGSAQVVGFGAIVQDNHDLGFGAVPGILSSAMRTTGSGCVAAVGSEATLGAADRTGSVAVYDDTVSTSALATCPVSLVSGPVVRTPADAAGADALVRKVDAARPAGSVLIVVGLSDTDPRDRAHLHVAIAAGGPYGPGLLRSQSTRRAPYVQLIDVTATLLSLAGAEEAPGVSSAVDGQPWEHVSGRAVSLATLVRADDNAGAVGVAIPYVVTMLVVLVVAAVAVTMLAWRRRSLRGLSRWLLLVAEAGPLASYLANLFPWLRADAPTVTALVLTAGIAVLLGSLATRLAVRTSTLTAAGALAAATFALLVLDVVTGSRLQLDSVLGYSPLVAGRFTGFGNVAFGVLGVAAMLTATAAAVRATGRSWPVVAAIGLVAVCADGAPMWGSDVGGVLSLVSGFAVMTLLCAGRRLSAAKAVLIAASAVGVVLVLGLADYARAPGAQTHLGRFVGKILHGGALTVLGRKAHADLQLLTANVGTLVVPFILAVAVWLVLRPRPRLAAAYDDHPPLRFGMISLAVLSLVGLVVNDSGLAIPAVAVLLAVPFVLGSLRHDSGSDTDDDAPVPPPEGQRVLP